ncbi:MAG TPA: alpha/beta hydrolase [Rhizobiaceae bacterium]|nr:alpha/beta hydrolase [Rhizobiaceae bacterium]
MIQAGGSTIDYVETGSGPVLLFLPGSYSTPAAWRPIQKLLPAGYRMAGTSLCGYGATEDTRTPADSGIEHEVEIVARVAQRLGDPIHLIGHSFGGTVALAAALSRRMEVASLSLFEANPLALLVGSALYNETLAMSRGFKAAVDAGEADAPARIIDFWGGAGSFAAMPEAVRDYCRKTVGANVIDWETDFGFLAGASDYAKLAMPVLLVRGALANPAMVAITDVLADALPNARRAVVPGAGHFLVSSHPAQCASLLGSFLANVTPRR